LNARDYHDVLILNMDRARNEAGLNVREAAELAGVDKRMWYYWKAGRTPTLHHLRQFAHGLGIKERDLLP
jgi:transcriptional regulator with XRE-family HTH domain